MARWPQASAIAIFRYFQYGRSYKSMKGKVGLARRIFGRSGIVAVQLRCIMLGGVLGVTSAFTHNDLLATSGRHWLIF